MENVTRIFDAICKGEPQAIDELFPLVYDELRRMAAQRLEGESPGNTLQATALVHEAYLRLVGPADVAWENRVYFFAAAAEAMRRILIDRARAKHRIKRGSGARRLDLIQLDLACPVPSEELLALNEALQQLEQKDSMKAQLVKLRFFAGMTTDQAAQVLGISRATAERYWSFARAWLYQELAAGDVQDSSSKS